MGHCFKCNKETLILITCRCRNEYCFKHKWAEKHNCQYDYKDKSFLFKTNPKIIGEKILNKI